jgi:formylglycine-generating enzyme required for sulfatase activity
MMIRVCTLLAVILAVAVFPAFAHAGGEKGPETITNSIGMKLTLVPSGEFVMGSNESNADLRKAFGDAAFEPGADEDGKLQTPDFSDEFPRHKVRITRAFYMGTCHVTLKEFLTFYHDAKYKCQCERDGKGGWGYDPNSEKKFYRSTAFVPWSWGFAGQTMEHPVVNVTWNDAVAFCAWLSKKEGRKYRLPTEAEWEYACRAGTTTRFHNGDDPRGLVLVGNVADATAKRQFPWWKDTVDAHDGYAFTAPVGQFKPNAFGLYDMHGNAWQWCSDYYSETYYAKSPVDDPQGPDAGRLRVARGGGWGGGPIGCRASNREGYAPTLCDYGIGFRVVCER